MSSRVAFLFPLALVAAVFAGCSSGGGGSNAGGNDGAIDSEIARAAAVLKARGWNDGAELLILGTVETIQDASEFLESTEESDGGGSFSSASKFFLEEFLPGADEDVGDGDAGTWFGVFSAPEETMLYVVAVTADGDTAGEEVDPEDDDQSYTPIGDYEIDSNSALDRAIEKGGENFEAAMTAQDGGVFYALVGPMEGYESMMDGPVWLVMSISETVEPTILFVDAETGQTTNLSEMMAAFGGGS